jgi:phage gp45-like
VIEAIRNLKALIAMSMTRAKVMLAGYSGTNARVMLQVSGLAGETLQNIELLLPYGMTAIPLAGDVVIAQINGNRDHKVALVVDNPACRALGLVAGEFGLQDDQGQQILVKRTGIVINSSLPITINSSGPVTITGSNISLNP